MADSHGNPWSAMEEGGSPWDDVPSRSHSNQSLAKDAEGNTASTTDQPSTSQSPTAEQPSSPTSSIASGIRLAPSKSRPSRRHANLAQSTTLETLDDSMGPLGPLGLETPATEEPTPTPPVKEPPSRSRQATTTSRPSTAASDLSTEVANGARLPPSTTARSLPLEQASQPTFSITVGDPHTISSATSSHTVYSVITRTTSKAYNTPTFTVTRRYRDFLWLYERLHDNHPGVVVPPPPEKQAVGRFDPAFVESRRMALERMVGKVANHAVLRHDGDLKVFLESEAFNVDIKHKERGKEALLSSENKGGIMSSIGLGGGSNSGGKFVEHDDWFHDRRIYLDALEVQLRALQKSTETVVAQRKALAESCAEFAGSLHALAGVELSPSLSGPLAALGDLQVRIQELYQRQALQDMLTLGIVIDEYIRLIGSVQKAFGQRQRAFHAWHSSEQKLAALRQNEDKLKRSGRSQVERMQQVEVEVKEQERKVNAARVLFEDMGRLMRGELERFEREKVEDFKSGVETFLEGAVEAQKELIELWETYLLQLDSDEDGPPLMPAGVYAEQPAKSEAQIRREEAKAQLEAENSAAQGGVAEGTMSLSGTTAVEGEGSVRDSGEIAHREGEAQT